MQEKEDLDHYNYGEEEEEGDTFPDVNSPGDSPNDI
jgi:hypothetical protein